MAPTSIMATTRAAMMLRASCWFCSTQLVPSRCRRNDEPDMLSRNGFNTHGMLLSTDSIDLHQALHQVQWHNKIKQWHAIAQAQPSEMQYVLHSSVCPLSQHGVGQCIDDEVSDNQSASPLEAFGDGSKHIINARRRQVPHHGDHLDVVCTLYDATMYP